MSRDHPELSHGLHPKTIQTKPYRADVARVQPTAETWFYEGTTVT